MKITRYIFYLDSIHYFELFCIKKTNIVIHNDLKPANIVVKKSSDECLLPYHIDIVDFGVACQQKNNCLSNHVFGSPHYIAPESLDGIYGYQSDVWSIGVMLYFALCHEFPFEYENEETNDNGDFSKLFDSIKNKKLEFLPKNTWEDISEDLKDLIVQMLNKNSVERIKIEKVLSHQVFNSFSKLYRKAKLTESECEQIKTYYDLTPIQKIFIKYSTKFIPTKKIDEIREKFLLQDTQNLGIYIWEYSSISDSCLTSDRDKSANLSPNRRSSLRQNKELSYSDFLAAMIAPKLLCSTSNIDIIFNTISPSSQAEEILSKDILKTLRLKANKHQVEIDELNNLFRKSKQIEYKSFGTAISKKWLSSFYSKINRKLSF